MKRAFSTLCCLNATPEEVAVLAVNNGIQGVEVRVGDRGTAFGSCTVSQAQTVHGLFEKAGIEVTDMALSCSISEYDYSQLEIGRSGIDFAAALGAHAVRIFVGAHQAHFTDEVKNDYDGIKKALIELSDYGREKNVAVWLETHSSFSSGKAMRGLLDYVGREDIGVIWDVMHSLEYHETPEETVKLLGGRIAHVHLKDGHPTADADATQYFHTDLGEGTMPVNRVVNALDAIGYEGYYSLEWESPWRKEIRDLYSDVNDLLRKYNDFLDCI